MIAPAGAARATRKLERYRQKGRKLPPLPGLEVHAGHGLSFETVQEIAALPEIVELNIGHFLIGAAVFIPGLEDVILQMRQLMEPGKEAAV